MVPTPSDQVHDKWKMLTLLTQAAPIYELSHRTLSVLRALMTFLPDRIISPSHNGSIVFPSNKTLSTRLNGMPESTIRRHLGQLVKSGIVSRHDSANRKRFTRYATGLGQVAFGFDLSPLAREMPTMITHVNAIQAEAETNAALRAQLGHLRQTLIDLSGPCDLTDTAFKSLRRKPDTDALSAICEAITAQIETLRTQEMSTTDNQNERHIQTDYISNSDSGPQISKAVRTKKTTPLETIVAQCTEYQSYFPDPVRHWHDLINIADRLLPMIGIERAVFDAATKAMGLKHASTIVLCILEKIGTIHNPGGFLRRLTQTFQMGKFEWSSIAPKQRKYA